MRTLLTVVMLVGAAALAGAQERLADQLKKGIVQEETGKSPEQAIQTYKAIVARYDEDRKVAATSLFRLAEVYRKAGNRAEAQAAYQRVVREFADQATLADQSRRQLKDAYGVSEARAARESEALVRAQRELLAAREELERARASEAMARDRAATTRAPRADGLAPLSEFSAGLIAIDDARRELAMLERRMADMKARIAIGTADTAAPLDLSATQDSYARVRARYEALLREREELQRRREAGLALNYKTLKSIEDEMALLEKQVRAMQERANVGLISPADPQLLQLQRDLLALQRKADEIKAAIAVNSIK